MNQIPETYLVYSDFSGDAPVILSNLTVSIPFPVSGSFRCKTLAALAGVRKTQQSQSRFRYLVHSDRLWCGASRLPASRLNPVSGIWFIPMFNGFPSIADAISESQSRFRYLVHSDSDEDKDSQHEKLMVCLNPVSGMWFIPMKG